MASDLAFVFVFAVFDVYISTESAVIVVFTVFCDFFVFDAALLVFCTKLMPV